MKQIGEYLFEKRLVSLYTGYQVVCYYYFEKDGKLMAAMAATQLHEAKKDEEIPEVTKKELIAMIENKMAQLS